MKKKPIDVEFIAINLKRARQTRNEVKLAMRGSLGGYSHAINSTMYRLESTLRRIPRKYSKVDVLDINLIVEYCGLLESKLYLLSKNR